MTDATPRKARRSRRLAVAGAALVAILLVGAGALALVSHRQTTTSKVDEVAARACRYPTDAAGRRYVSHEAATAGVNYIKTLQAMYYRCPHRGVATPLRRPSVLLGTRANHQHTSTRTPRGSSERGDSEDDGGD